MPFTSIVYRLLQLPKWTSIVGVLALIAAVGYCDVLIGEDVTLWILYLPILACVCWRFDLKLACGMSLLCSLMPLLDRSLVGKEKPFALPVLWDVLIRFSVFIAFAVVLSALRQAKLRERELERRDFLTGIANSKSFLERAQRELEQCRQSGTSFTIAYIDCDNFKTINDTLGHLTGDELLKTVAVTLTTTSRNGDAVSRLGGDEFAMLMPQTFGESAVALVGHVQDSLLAAMRANGWPVTFSIGAATFTQPPESVTELIRIADELMYSVKRADKNAIEYKTIGQQAEA